MKIMKFILVYLFYLLMFLAQSQQRSIHRPESKKLQDKNENLNILELITEVAGELSSEKKRKRRDCHPDTFFGSNLFDGIRRKCFTAEEISLMTARVEFESMIPVKMPPKLLNDKQVNLIIRYFCYGHFLIGKTKDCVAGRIIRKAFYDTIGGFLHYYLIPITKASFYAGRVKVKTVLKVIAHYHKCRKLLNTNGNGWRNPVDDPIKHLQKGCIKPLRLRLGDSEMLEEPKSCIQLNLQSGVTDGDIVDDSMLVALPKIEIEDSDGFLGNIYLPYLRKRTFNLRSPKSAYVLADFYKTVRLCYVEKNLDANVYNCKLKEWIMENVQMHLNDKIFYPGFGRVLNLYETLRKPHATSCMESENDYGQRKKRCKAEIDEAIRKHKCKSLKFINLENRANQCKSHDCEKNWLEDPLVSGKAIPKSESCEEWESKNKNKFFGIFKGSKKNKSKSDFDMDIDLDLTKENTESKNKSKEEDDKDIVEKKKSKWGKLSLSRFYKKGSWGFVFPKLKGLSMFGKIWEIFKFIFLMVLIIFLLCLLYKIIFLASTVIATPMKCVEYLIRALYEFGKLFLRVLAACCACLAILPCWRMCGGKGGKKDQDKDRDVERALVDKRKNKKKEAKTDTKNKKDSVRKSREVTPPKDEKKSKWFKKSKDRGEKNSKKEKRSKSVDSAPTSDEENRRKLKEKNKPKKDRSKSQEFRPSSDESGKASINWDKSKRARTSGSQERKSISKAGKGSKSVDPRLSIEPDKNSKAKNSFWKRKRSKSQEPPSTSDESVKKLKGKDKSNRNIRSKSQEPRTSSDESGKKSKKTDKSSGERRSKSKERRSSSVESDKKSKEKDKSKKDKRSKSQEPRPSSDESDKKSKDKDKSSKKRSKSQERRPSNPGSSKKLKENDKTKKDRRSKSQEPPPTSDDEPNKKSKEKDKNKKDKKTKEKESKADKKSKAKKEKEKTRSSEKESKSPLKNEKKEKKSRKSEDEKQVSFDESMDRKKRSSRRSPGHRESADRRRGGEDKTDTNSDWHFDTSGQEDCDGKTSWKTYYDF